jgi:hypothetical protein
MAQDKDLEIVGATVDKQIYDRFVTYVEEKHAKKRGVLGMELERAMRRHMDRPEDEDVLTKISEDLGEIKEAVGAHGDGGKATARVESRTHTQTEQDAYTYEDPGGEERDAPTKPGAKAATQDKVSYLLETFVSKNGDGTEGEFILPDDVDAHISENYDFGDRTVRKYRDKLIERLKKEYVVGKHPQNDKIVCFAEDEDAVRNWTKERE